MENAILYTFSTIAQALAGAFALLAAFVLYRLQSLENVMWEDSEPLIGGELFAPQEAEQLQVLRRRRNYAQFLTVLDAALAARRERHPSEHAGPYGPSSIDRLAGLRQLSSAGRRIKCGLWLALWLTAAVMTYSVVALPFAHLIHCDSSLSWRVLVIGVGGFVSCLMVYLSVISHALA